MFEFSERINFKAGHPSDDLLHPEFLEIAVKHTFDREKNNPEEKMFTYRTYNYGNYQGDPYVRNEIAKYLTREISFKHNPDNIFLTSGVSQAVDMLCTTFLNEGDNILIEGPTYFHFLTIFKDHHLNIFTINRNDEGTLDLDLLEKIVSENNIKVFYNISTGHNPTSKNLPLEQRKFLYNMALKYKMYLWCDDIYELLFFDGGASRVAPIVFCSDEVCSKKEKHFKEILESDFSNNPYVLSLNSFNKLVNPGMRVGWIYADEHIITKLKKQGWIMSGGNPANTMSHIIRSYIELGLIDKIVNGTREDFAYRAKEVNDVLKGSQAFTYDLPYYGYFFWLKVSEKVNLTILKKKLLDADIHVMFGEAALLSELKDSLDFKYLQRRIRICFVRYETKFMCEMLKELRSILESSME